MISDDHYQELVSAFPELTHPFTYLQKEIYAFFGLLFYGFSLVETTLINAIAINSSAEAHDGHSDFAKCVEKEYQKVRRKTFGRLRTEVLQIHEFYIWKNDLDKAKSERDYFTHHFCREEFNHQLSDEECWHYIWEMYLIRKGLRRLDSGLQHSFRNMCIRLDIMTPGNEELNARCEQLTKELRQEVVSGKRSFGWNSKSEKQ